MGAIHKILANRDLPERELHNSRLFVDLSENVHIHFREIRLMFGVDEFFEFAGVLRRSARDVKRYLKRHPGYREQQVFDGLMVAGGLKQQLTPLQKSPRPHESKYFPNRLQIELQEEEVIDAVHLHYRDYRLVMNIATFRELAGAMGEALSNLDTHLRDHPYTENRHPFRQVVGQEAWAQERITWLDRLKRRLRRLTGRE
jgi:hypothetical protein